MRKTTLACALLVFSTFSADAFGVYLYNRSGGTLCAAETRDEAEPYDENVGRITTGWKCVEDFGTLHIERSDGVLDVAIKKADGADYVAGDTSLKIPKIKVYVPKDDTTEVFGVEIMQHSLGWVAYSWSIGAGNEWSPYRTVSDIEELPATLDGLGFKQVDAWRFDAQHNGLGYTLK